MGTMFTRTALVRLHQRLNQTLIAKRVRVQIDRSQILATYIKNCHERAGRYYSHQFDSLPEIYRAVPVGAGRFDTLLIFDALGDLIRTGPSGTNVGDLQVFLLA